MTRMVLATFISTFLMAGAAFAQPQISVSPASVAPGQSVTITVTGPPGRFYAVIGSSVNSGVSYAGVALGVGSDFTIIRMGSLDGSGVVSFSYTPPFTGTTFDRFYVQAATSTAPDFRPLEVSASVVIRNADLSPAADAWFVGGSPFASISLPGPKRNFMVWGTVFINNTTGAEYHAACTVGGANLSGSVALAVGDVPGGRQITMPLLSLITTTAPTTVTVHCGSPPAGITVGAAIAEMEVGVIH